MRVKRRSRRHPAAPTDLHPNPMKIPLSTASGVLAQVESEPVDSARSATTAAAPSTRHAETPSSRCHENEDEQREREG